MMYICENCGHYFDEPAWESDLRCPEYFVRKDYRICPNCHSKAFGEAPICNVCGKHFNGEKTEDICPDCLDEIKYQIDRAISEISKNLKLPTTDCVYGISEYIERNY